MDVGQPEVASLESVSQALVIQAKAMEDGGVEVVDVNRVFRDVVTEIVGLPVRDPRFDAAAGHPHRIIAAMMIAAVVVLLDLALTINGASKFAAPENEG